jgi:hypothetical protein
VSERAQPEAEPRFFLEPDPAWDVSTIDGDLLEVELSWFPDALEGRLDELLVSPALVDSLMAAGITGFTTGPGRGFFTDNALVDPNTMPPALVRLLVGDDVSADLAYLSRECLVASDRARAIISQHCTRLDVEEVKRPLNA